jgi:anthranilate/para-aminobenzoate synthase component I
MQITGRINENRNLIRTASRPRILNEKDHRYDVADTTVSSNRTQEEYEAMVERIRQYIYDGDIIQCVPSQRIARPTSASAFSIYRSLRSVNPSPYMYFLHLNDFEIVGASPELLVRVEEHRFHHPSPGRDRGGPDADDDKALAEELINDEKERAPARHAGGSARTMWDASASRYRSGYAVMDIERIPT